MTAADGAAERPTPDEDATPTDAVTTRDGAAGGEGAGAGGDAACEPAAGEVAAGEVAAGSGVGAEVAAAADGSVPAASGWAHAQASSITATYTGQCLMPRKTP